jgi:membrane associated rhomboid family serine protease
MDVMQPHVVVLGAGFGINFIFGVGTFPSLTGGETVAWQAHVGGFLAGLLLFSWFDPAPVRPDESFDAMRQ